MAGSWPMDTGQAPPIEMTWSHILVGPPPAGRLVSLAGISEVVKSQGKLETGRQGKTREMLQLQGNHSAQPSGKVYSRVLERQLRLIEPWTQEQQCGFCSGCRMVDQLSCPAWGSLAVCPFVVNMCFVDLEKSYDLSGSCHGLFCPAK